LESESRTNGKIIVGQIVVIIMMAIAISLGALVAFGTAQTGVNVVPDPRIGAAEANDRDRREDLQRLDVPL
jgi:hypothetical protein